MMLSTWDTGHYDGILALKELSVPGNIQVNKGMGQWECIKDRLIVVSILVIDDR